MRAWTSIHNGLVDLAGNIAHAHGLAVQPGNSQTLLCAAGQRIFKSTDQGNDWTVVLNLGVLPTCVAFSPSVATTCYAATDHGTVFKSDNAGDDFTWNIPYGYWASPPQGVIAALAISHTDPNRLYIGYAQFGVAHAWRSDDGGANWTNASGTGAATLPDIPVSGLAVHHLNSDIVCAATDIGVFRTTDGGTTWQTFNDGMPRTVVSGLAYRSSSRTLYASTMGRGAYYRGVWLG